MTTRQELQERVDFLKRQQIIVDAEARRMIEETNLELTKAWKALEDYDHDHPEEVDGDPTVPTRR